MVVVMVLVIVMRLITVAMMMVVIIVTVIMVTIKIMTVVINSDGNNGDSDNDDSGGGSDGDIGDDDDSGGSDGDDGDDDDFDALCLCHNNKDQTSQRNSRENPSHQHCPFRSLPFQYKLCSGSPWHTPQPSAVTPVCVLLPLRTADNLQVRGTCAPHSEILRQASP